MQNDLSIDDSMTNQLVGSSNHRIIKNLTNLNHYYRIIILMCDIQTGKHGIVLPTQSTR